MDPEFEATNNEDLLIGPVDAVPTIQENLNSVRFDFTPETFKQAMDTYGIENVVAGLAKRAGKSVPPEYAFDIDSIRSGEAEFLDFVGLTKDLSKEERVELLANPEVALNIFSNVEDFGKFDTENQRYSGLEAVGSAFKRALPEGMLMSEGSLLGAAAMKKRASAMSARTTPQIAAKLGMYALGVIPGMIIGQKVGEEISDYTIGEPIPVTPSLMAYNNFGETAGLIVNPSVLTQPFRWTKDANWLGANRFIENYKLVTKGGWPTAERASELVKASSGLSSKSFASALGSKSGRKYVFGRVGFDAAKGPVGARTLGALETGIGGMSARAAATPFVTPALEAVMGGGASSMAFVAEAYAPGSEGWRFLAEMTGAAAPGPLISGTMRGGRAVKTRIKDLFTKMANTDPVGDIKRSVGMERLLEGIRANPDYTGEDMLQLFLDEIKNAPASEKKIPLSLFAASKNNPLTKILQRLDLNLGTVSDELEVATEKGREQFLANAKASIMDLKDDGSPEAVQLASLLQKNLFEESLQNEMTSRLDLFFQSLDAVTKGDSKKLEKYDVSNLVYDRLKQFTSDVAERTAVFWDDVGDYDLTNFDESNLPRIMTIFDTPYAREEGAGLKFASETKKAQFWTNLPDGAEKDLKLVFNYFGRNLDGTQMDEPGLDAVETLSPRVKKVKEAFELAQDRVDGVMIGGNNMSDEVQDILERGDRDFAQIELSYTGGINPETGRSALEEKATFFREQAMEALENAQSEKGFDNNEFIKLTQLAKVLDKLADFKAVEARDVIEGSQTAAARLSAGAVDGQEVENPLTARRLFDLRSALLGSAASLGRNRDPRSGGSQTAESMRRMADAVLQDLLSDDTASQPYNLARAFTLASRDVTERSFIGNFSDLDIKGREVVTPDNALDYIFKKGGSDAVNLRFRELDAARDFMSSQMGLSAEDAASKVGDVDASMKMGLKYFLSELTKEMPNPANPGEMIEVIDTNALKRFKAKPENQELLRRYPTIARDLGTAEGAQNLLSTLGKEANLFNTSANVEALNAVIGTGEKAGLIAANAITSPEPFKQLKFVINLIKEQQNVKISPEGGLSTTFSPRESILGEDGLEYTQQQALNGLRSSILTYATSRSGNEGIKFDARTMFDTLFTKLPNMTNKDASLVKFMEQEKLMSKEQISSMKTALKQMMNIDEAFQKGNIEEVLFKRPTKAKLLAARAAGAMMGSRGMNQINKIFEKLGFGSGGNTMGAGMVIARGGAESAQDFFLVAPEAAINKGMIEIMQDPDMFRELTLEIQSKAQYEASNRLVNDFMANLGVSQIAKRQQIIARPLLMGQESYEPYVDPDAGVEPEEASKTRPRFKSGADPAGLFKPRLPSNDQQGSLAPVQRPSPVGPPTTQASAVPSSPPPPVNSAPVDRTRYAALFPNDTISSMMQQTQQMARGGIASLMR